MRKLIAFTTLCFFSLLLKNERAICKSNCDVSSKTTIAHSPGVNQDTETEALSNLQPYDGFFKKL